MFTEEPEYINLVFVIIFVVLVVLFVIWVLYRGIVDEFSERHIHSRKGSIAHKHDPNLRHLLYDVAVRDGNRIRAWLPEDADKMRRSVRDPFKKRMMKKKIEVEQKKNQNTSLDEIAASQLQGPAPDTFSIDFIRHMPQLSGRRKQSVPPKPHQMVRRHSSFFGTKNFGPGGQQRSRNDSVGSNNSFISAVAGITGGGGGSNLPSSRKHSIASLPSHQSTGANSARSVPPLIMIDSPLDNTLGASGRAMSMEHPRGHFHHNLSSTSLQEVDEEVDSPSVPVGPPVVPPCAPPSSRRGSLFNPPPIFKDLHSQVLQIIDSSASEGDGTNSAGGLLSPDDEDDDGGSATGYGGDDDSDEEGAESLEGDSGPPSKKSHSPQLSTPIAAGSHKGSKVEFDFGLGQPIKQTLSAQPSTSSAASACVGGKFQIFPPEQPAVQLSEQQRNGASLNMLDTLTNLAESLSEDEDNIDENADTMDSQCGLLSKQKLFRYRRKVQSNDALPFKITEEATKKYHKHEDG